MSSEPGQLLPLRARSIGMSRARVRACFWGDSMLRKCEGFHLIGRAWTGQFSSCCGLWSLPFPEATCWSLDQNVGNPLLEAMSCGRCIFALNTGDTGGVIENGVNGIVVGVDELPRLPKIVCSLLRDPGLRRELGSKAREFAARRVWTWEERMQAEVSLVGELIGRPADAGSAAAHRSH